MKIINLENFEKASYKDLIDLECEHCGCIFSRKKNYIQCALNRNDDRKERFKYCSVKCSNESHITKQKCICTQCNKEFYKTLSQIGIHNFCSASCSAIYNNRNPSEKRIKSRRKPEGSCKICHKVIYTNLLYCKDCSPKKNLDTLTIDQVVRKRKGSNKYDGIRNRARNLYSDKITKCELCDHVRGVQVCHIVPISKFPKDTLVSVVNSLQNVAFLCPNCHWDLDHGFLQIGEMLLRLTHAK